MYYVIMLANALSHSHQFPDGYFKATKAKNGGPTKSKGTVLNHTALVSVRRSSPRTTKGPRTGPDWTDLGPDCSPGPTLVLSGPVLVLKIFWDVKDRSWTSPDRS